MNWYQPQDKLILDWRHWRTALPQDPADALLEIQNFWYSAPWRKNSRVSDDAVTWPSPWQLFNNISYCERLRALGMFYTICLTPPLRALNPMLILNYDSVGDRVTSVIVDGGRWILNVDPGKLVNTASISKEYQQLYKYLPQDFTTLE